MIGVALSTVDLLIQRRALHVVRVGHLTKIPRSEIDRFIRNGGVLEVWPKKRNGKTTRRVEPPMKKPLMTTDVTTDVGRADYKRRESA